MSHFTVLVVGDDPEEQLAPFQETSEGQYAQFIDKTEEYSKQYAEDKIRVYEYGGEWLYPWRLPDDVDKSTLPSKESKMTELFPTLKEYVVDWHGAEEHEGKFGYFANPNAKWDWYQLGGRWAGYFKIKPGAEHVVGEGGAFSNAARPGWADQLRKRDIDIEGMREDARKNAEEQYDEFEAATKGLEPPLKSFHAFRADFENIEAARDAWHSQPWVRATNRLHVFGDPLEIFRVHTGGRAKYVESAVESVLSTFAVLMDGQWYEQGSMGWWGIVADEKSEYDWCAKFTELFDSLPDDTLLSVYDCHI